jgi:hypothetical protein
MTKVWKTGWNNNDIFQTTSIKSTTSAGLVHLLFSCHRYSCIITWGRGEREGECLRQFRYINRMPTRTLTNKSTLSWIQLRHFSKSERKSIITVRFFKSPEAVRIFGISSHQVGSRQIPFTDVLFIKHAVLFNSQKGDISHYFSIYLSLLTVISFVILTVSLTNAISKQNNR